eukprot:UN06002
MLLREFPEEILRIIADFETSVSDFASIHNYALRSGKSIQNTTKTPELNQQLLIFTNTHNRRRAFSIFNYYYIPNF